MLMFVESRVDSAESRADSARDFARDSADFLKQILQRIPPHKIIIF